MRLLPRVPTRIVFHLLLFIIPAVISKPIEFTFLYESQAKSLSIRSSHQFTSNTLLKRARPTFFPGGWSYSTHSIGHFNHIPSAATTLEYFYQFALSGLSDPSNFAVQTRTLSISDDTFELLFRIRNRWQYPEARVSMLMVQAFVTLMRFRARRGLAIRYEGWLKGPGGVVVDVVLQTMGTSPILDSAMDMYPW
ncbi:MAG: hypothetical protein Q9166_002555 [cf. Caloplaca sp. 2 TL-2023]